MAGSAGCGTATWITSTATETAHGVAARNTERPPVIFHPVHSHNQSTSSFRQSAPGRPVARLCHLRRRDSPPRLKGHIQHIRSAPATSWCSHRPVSEWLGRPRAHPTRPVTPGRVADRCCNGPRRSGDRLASRDRLQQPGPTATHPSSGWPVADTNENYPLTSGGA